MPYFIEGGTGMSPEYDVRIKVISQEGRCGAGHKVGDEWIVGATTPGGMCFNAFAVLQSNIRILRFGGKFPWGRNPDSLRLACSDFRNPVIFEISRIYKPGEEPPPVEAAEKAPPMPPPPVK